MHFAAFVLNAFMVTAAIELSPPVSNSKTDDENGVGMENIQQWGFKRFLVPQQDALLRSGGVRHGKIEKTFHTSQKLSERVSNSSTPSTRQRFVQKGSKENVVATKKIPKVEYADKNYALNAVDPSSTNSSEMTQSPNMIKSSKFVKSAFTSEIESSSVGKVISHLSFSEKKIAELLKKSKVVLEKRNESQPKLPSKLNESSKLFQTLNRMEASISGIELNSDHPVGKIVTTTEEKDANASQKDRHGGTNDAEIGAKAADLGDLSHRKQKANDSSKDVDSIYLWTIAGPIIAGVVILIIIVIAVGAKSGGSSGGKGTYNVNSPPRIASGELERYTNYNGPSSFSETISLPSQTDGSVSQGEQSMEEENFGSPALDSAQPLPKAAQKIDDFRHFEELSFQ